MSAAKEGAKMSESSAASVLEDPVAVELLRSTEPARLAYAWTDGTPRVVPIWFHWDGQQLVFGSPADAPKVAVLRERPDVAVTIDRAAQFPYKVLVLRGEAEVREVDGLTPEYVSSAHRYFGEEQGAAWVEMVGQLALRMVRVSVTPHWARVLDFETRFPSALARAMAAAQG
jgi:nitroimidazol reductase NimA-like FMN-containing flavoprotein (pyridoxamine 5'-phosphate oxidase superfamily)